MEKLFSVIMVPIVVFLLYILLVIIPVALWAEAKCLRNGYPKSSVTIGLETYCMNLDGSVTVRVENTSKAGAK